MNHFAKTMLVACIGGMLWAGTGAISATAAQDSNPSMLTDLRKGEWSVRFRDGSSERQICVRTGIELLQLRHDDQNCSRFIVGEEPDEVTVHYTCPGNGYGRTNIRMETPILLQVESQGIAKGLPFEFNSEARYIGSC